MQALLKERVALQARLEAQEKESEKSLTRVDEVSGNPS